MDNKKIQVARYSIIKATSPRLLKSFIISILKGIPFLIVVYGLSKSGILILQSIGLQSNVDLELKIASISLYISIGALMLVLLQIMISFFQPNYSKDIKELLLINNEMLILKEAGLLDEDELIDFLKRNHEIGGDQQINAKDMEEIKKGINNYDKLNKKIEATIIQQEVRNKILK